ncbi:hypothetical protein MG293_001411 [Ovis ammon polii]|uniref:Uncharacterized protein n=1 Tax=Ovis ammon polii TaxID=230172 RepID=A0AAD4UN04_OVIAM|nr:hypothetical protein MG293_001411 [Ovis ammon polii]
MRKVNEKETKRNRCIVFQVNSVLEPKHRELLDSKVGEIFPGTDDRAWALGFPNPEDCQSDPVCQSCVQKTARKENSESEKFSNLPKIIQLRNGAQDPPAGSKQTCRCHKKDGLQPLHVFDHDYLDSIQQPWVLLCHVGTHLEHQSWYEDSVDFGALDLLTHECDLPKTSSALYPHQSFIPWTDEVLLKKKRDVES